MKRALILCVLCWPFWCFSQSVLDTRLDGSEQGKKLAVVLQDWQARYGVRCFFLPEWVEPITVTQSYAGQTMQIALDDIFLGTDLNYVLLHGYALVLVKDPAQAIQRRAILRTAVQEKKQVEKVVLGDPQHVKRGQPVRVQGTVVAAETKEPLVGASVLINDLGTGATTNADGKFELKVPPGAHVVTVGYVNYQDKVYDLEAWQDGSLAPSLDENPTLLDELVVQDRATQEITSTRIGITQINIREIKRSPALLGEVDLVKQIQTLPGVTTAGEAASGFNVRGGSVDQNLVLYDGTPVFNSSHVFGFFSTFNSEALRDVNFYRGGIPAEYGGRVSSVLDIRSKEGDYEKWKASGGIGLISSNLMIGGPIKKDKTSIAISGRTTYSDWITNSIRTSYADLKKSSVSFYDATFKLAHKFSDKTKLTVSGYASNDFFRLKGDSSYQWSNKLASARLDHQFSTALSADFTLSTGSYGYNIEDRNPVNGFTLGYKISYPALRANFHLQAGDHHISFGLQSMRYNFAPGDLDPASTTSGLKQVSIDRQKALESAIYIGDGYSLGDKAFIEGGMRLSIFNAMGPASIYQYQPGVPRETSTIIDTLHYGSGQVYKTYFGLEPRASFRYNLSPTWSLKAGYNRIYQYVNLVTNTTAVTPVDIWQPSGYYFKPQMADQVSLGLFNNFKDRKYEIFGELYYKKLDNILDFKDGAQLILNRHIETDLLQGKGRTYGAEFSFTKNTGRITGMLNYTYSRSLRTIAGPTSAESVNDGREYASNFDQPHMINANWKIGLSRRIFLTGNFTYRTGRPVTLPQSAFSIDNMPVAYFSDRNQYRIADYHRLDLALVFEGNLKRHKIWDGTFIISVYNVYARKNPYTVFYKDNLSGVLQPYQLSIVGVAFPSVTYTFRIN